MIPGMNKNIVALLISLLLVATAAQAWALRPITTCQWPNTCAAAR